MDKQSQIEFDVSLLRLLHDFYKYWGKTDRVPTLTDFAKWLTTRVSNS